MTDTPMTGTLDDFDLMTEGEHKGKYAIRLDGVPYPVLSHVDAFLLRMQKGTRVDVMIKDVDGKPWVNKIMRSQKLATSASTATTAERMQKAGFDVPEKKPVVSEVMSEKDAALLKARADAAAAEKAHNADMAAKSKEAAQKKAKEQQERDAELLRAAQVETAPVDGIAGIVAATKANVERVTPTPVVQLVPACIAPKNYSNDEMLLLRNVIAKGCSEPEFKLLMYMANTYGLGPLLKQIWAVKRSDSQPALIFAGRDGMLAIAHRSGRFDGMQSGVVYDGERKPVSAWCEIWRNDMSHSFKTEVPFSEYNTGFSVWKSNPSAMIIKVAEAVCLRKAFSVSGLYCPEEIPAGA